MSRAARLNRNVVRRSWLSALALTICVASGCGNPAASVIIDNTSPSTMVVKIDGKTAARIDGHSFHTIRLMPGRYPMEIEVGGRRVFRGTRVVEEADGFLASKTYVFNPASSAKYASCKVVYGDSMLSEATESAIVTLAENYTGKKVDETRLKYIQVKRYAIPMPGSSWFELPGGISYILRDAPEYVYTRSAETSRRVLTRLPKDVHSRLRKAHRIENPTEQDLYALIDVTEEAIDSMSLLEPTP